MTNFKFLFKLASENKKTGPIPVSTTEKSSCPETCPFMQSGCYAKGGPINIHWNKIPEKGIDSFDFLGKIRNLPKGQLWRHNQAGDLPHVDGKIDTVFLDALTQANKGKKGFTYTHHLTTKENLKAVKKANRNGFTVNLSANNVTQAVEYANHGVPVVCVVPSDTTKKSFTFGDKKFVVCPATYKDDIQCYNCGICQKADRKTIVAFPAHGIGKAKVDKVIETI
jgi:hypothetical protein